MMGGDCMPTKHCNKCGREYYESPAEPTTFFCTDRCAKAASNSPKIARHAAWIRSCILAESQTYSEFPEETSETSYERITRLAKDQTDRELPFGSE
jgi:hypothetical protein